MYLVLSSLFHMYRDSLSFHILWSNVGSSSIPKLDSRRKGRKISGHFRDREGRLNMEVPTKIAWAESGAKFSHDLRNLQLSPWTQTVTGSSHDRMMTGTLHDVSGMMDSPRRQEKNRGDSMLSDEAPGCGLRFNGMRFSKDFIGGLIGIQWDIHGIFVGFCSELSGCS